MRLLFVLVLLVSFYVGVFVWPTPWRYDRVGRTPVRTNRVTGAVEFLNLQGWQPAIPPGDVRRDAAVPAPAVGKGVRPQVRKAQNLRAP